MSKDLTADDFEKIEISKESKYHCEGCFFDSDKEFCSPMILSINIESVLGLCNENGEFIFKLKPKN